MLTYRNNRWESRTVNPDFAGDRSLVLCLELPFTRAPAHYSLCAGEKGQAKQIVESYARAGGRVVVRAYDGVNDALFDCLARTEQEFTGLPTDLYGKRCIAAFLDTLIFDAPDVTLASQASLAREWNLPSEDKAWAALDAPTASARNGTRR